MSYVSNVVQMFAEFGAREHTLLLTANVQRDGMATKLLGTIKEREERRRRVLNLLEVGELSGVQKGELDEMKSVVKRALA